MHAVIETGGQQFRVAVGDVVNVARLAEPVGGDVVFDRVLMVGNGAEARLGTPTVGDARVRATVVCHDRDRKLLSYVSKRRKNSARKTHGHRQSFTSVRIEAIEA